MNEKSRKTNRLWVVAAFLTAGLLVWTAARSHWQEPDGFPHGEMQIRHADGSRYVYAIELATTSDQQERGLMFRENLPPGTGMLFLWPEAQPVSMWMKNTVIPLDMLFVEQGGAIVKITANAVPYDLTPLASGQPVRAVVEIGGGEAARQNIRVGDKVIYPALTAQEK